jgi:hypothetical protein
LDEGFRFRQGSALQEQAAQVVPEAGAFERLLRAGLRWAGAMRGRLAERFVRLL